MFLGRWARAGIAAAAVALIAAGVASVYTQGSDNTLAYAELLNPDSVPVTTFERVTATQGISEDEAALRYVLSILEGSGR
jgi:hypothetical protein